jgi:hypothetical protein
MTDAAMEQGELAYFRSLDNDRLETGGYRTGDWHLHDRDWQRKTRWQTVGQRRGQKFDEKREVLENEIHFLMCYWW